MGKKALIRQAEKRAKMVSGEKVAEMMAPFQESTSLRGPHLIQRVLRRQDSDRLHPKSGVDACFAMDYMGSAEFEWGALPQTLKQMRANLDAIRVMSMDVKGVKGQNHRVWFVGPESSYGVAMLFAECEIHGSPVSYSGDYRQSLKEMANFKPILEDTADWGRDVIGWWSVGEGNLPNIKTGWALFMAEKDADMFLACLRK